MREELIKRIIEKYTFVNKKKKDPDFCPCYNRHNGNKCHNLDDNELICVLCWCPSYEKNAEIPQGICKIDSPHGFYFHDPNLPPEGIWDCSNCNIPQTKKFVSNYLKRFSEEKLKKILETNFRTSKELFDFLMKE